jgi:hypothetical protein
VTFRRTIALTSSRPDRRLFAQAIVVLVAVAAVAAACNTNSSPTGTPNGARPPADLAEVPKPLLATTDLGQAGPGFDGSGSFLSYDSDLDPMATIGAYASQLLQAGFHEAGTNGIWRVFVGPRLTVWVRVGSGGPPTSLLVRVQPTAETDLSPPYSRPTAGPTAAAGSTGGTAGAGSPKPPSRPTQVRRPDPPHGTGATAGGGTPGGDPVAGGGSTGSGTGTGTSTGSGSGSGSGAAGGAGTDGSRSSPRP